MSENSNTALDALTGNSSSAPAEDWKSKYEELEKRYNSARVEEGRVKKLDEELKARDRRIAELEANRRNEDLVSSLSEDERAGIPDEVLSAATKLVSRGMSNVRAENERRMKEWEERTMADKAVANERAKQALVERINVKYPGFLNAVSAGGDKADQWNKYQRFNAASISGAVNTGDYETLAYHIENFYSNFLGVRVPSGEKSGSAAPDPRESGGGTMRGAQSNGQEYTAEEFDNLFELKEKARDRGDWAEVKRISDEINRAQAEGRVK